MQKLRDDRSFLEMYRKQRDVFSSLLGRATYLSHYSRNETWSETILRVVDANCDLDSRVTMDERKELYQAIFTMKGLPSGRGLWVGGVPGIPNDAAMNCWSTTIKNVDEWGWVANQLMLGGGVGVNLTENMMLGVVDPHHCFLSMSILPTHNDHTETKKECGTCYAELKDAKTYVHDVADSREGWCRALVIVLRAAMQGNSVHLNLTPVRGRGSLIRTFGGVASGPAPLALMLRSVWETIRAAAGRTLSSVDTLDVTTHIGKCIKSGNVRRSALLTSGHYDDMDFRLAKSNEEAVYSHRHNSNNSIRFTHPSQFTEFNWRGLVEDNLVFGDPGVQNLWLARKQDPDVVNCNPCAEIFLIDRESCNLVEVFPALGGDTARVLRLMARFAFRNRLMEFSDPQTDAARRSKMRIGVGLGGVCDFDCRPELLQYWYKVVREECNKYADDIGVNRPMSVTTVKPSGTISLLNRSAPGMHSDHAPYYLRRMRLDKDKDMAYALAEAGVPYETCMYDHTGNTRVFVFPMMSKNKGLTAQNETTRDQFERQLMLQKYWADNSVSATITFEKDKADEMAALMSEFVPQLKSTSFLTKEHGYAQAPYEAVEEHVYREFAAKINSQSELAFGGELESAECSSGACPVR